jgi:hypothetical protein
LIRLTLSNSHRSSKNEGNSEQKIAQCKRFSHCWEHRENEYRSMFVIVSGSMWWVLVKKHFTNLTNLVGNWICFFFFGVLTQGTFLKILEVFEDYYNQCLNYKFIIKLLHFLSVRLCLFIGIIQNGKQLNIMRKSTKIQHFKFVKGNFSLQNPF